MFDPVKERNFYNGPFADSVRAIGSQQDKLRAIKCVASLKGLIEQDRNKTKANLDKALPADCILTPTWLTYFSAYSALEGYLHLGIDLDIPGKLQQARDISSDAISEMAEGDIELNDAERTPLTDDFFKYTADVFGLHHAKCSQIYAAIKTCRLVLNGRA